MLKYITALFQERTTTYSHAPSNSSEDQFDTASAFIYSLEIEEEHIHPDLEN